MGLYCKLLIISLKMLYVETLPENGAKSNSKLNYFEELFNSKIFIYFKSHVRGIQLYKDYL